MKTIECDKAKLDGMPILVTMTDIKIGMLTMDAERYKDLIKNKLADMIAECIMENNLCEFTQIHNPNTFENTYRCRAFLLTRECVKELRETHQI